MVWNWNAYPRSAELNLGTMRAQIQPKQSLEIKSEAQGILSLNVDKRVTNVPKDFVWARMNMDEIQRPGNPPRNRRDGQPSSEPP